MVGGSFPLHTKPIISSFATDRRDTRENYGGLYSFVLFHFNPPPTEKEFIMFNWIKKLFKRKEKKVDLLIVCGSIQELKPLKKKPKRDAKGRFTK